MLIACLPFSQPIKTQGTWVIGFEKNDFFEGRRPPPADLMWTGSTGSQLILDEKDRGKIPPVGPQTYALQVDLVGRRALCPIGLIDVYPIAVEQLTIERRIATR